VHNHELLKTVMKLSVNKMRGISWLPEEWLAFRDRLCTMESQ